MPWPGTTFIADSMSAWVPWPCARRYSTACSCVMPAGSWRPNTPSKIRFVALPSSLGPITASVTDATANTMTSATGTRSGRSIRTNRAPDALKFIDFSPGMPAAPIHAPGPRPRAPCGSRAPAAGACGAFCCVLTPPPPR